MNKIIRLSTSPSVTLWLFALLVLLLIPSTFLLEYTPLLLTPVKVILGLVGFNLVVCTLHKLKTLRRSTLVIHLGVITILAGGLISTFGFMATVNVYEGASINKVFRWDIQQDVLLDFDLHITKIHFDYYPVSIKIGILKNGEKADLIVTSTNDFFVFEDFRVKILSFNPRKKELQLHIETLDGKLVGTMFTSGQKELPPDFPLDFKLVAFQDPVVKRFWVDLELRENGKLIMTGPSEINHPLKWQGMNFFLTQLAVDNMDRPYAGIQISKDPGIPYVYCGFYILCFGLLLLFNKWLRNR